MILLPDCAEEVAMTEAKEKASETCIHYWVLDERNVGRCSKCNKRRDFGRMMEKEGEKHKNHLKELSAASKDRRRKRGTTK